MQKTILMVEPDYYTKFPPLGLLKLAAYHRDIGDNVLLSTFGAGFSWGAMYIKWGIAAHA